jgi:hypothetical protein
LKFRGGPNIFDHLIQVRGVQNNILTVKTDKTEEKLTEKTELK